MASELEIQKLKIKRILDQLQISKGDGTSLITLLIPSGGNINLIKQRITEEYSNATNIKSRL